MSLADALYWAGEHSTSNEVQTVWKNPLETLPDIVYEDPDIKGLRTSRTVLVKIERSANAEQYSALAKYTETTDENSNTNYQWKVEHHTGNWDSKVVGWYHIPSVGE